MFDDVKSPLKRGAKTNTVRINVQRSASADVNPPSISASLPDRPLPPRAKKFNFDRKKLIIVIGGVVGLLIAILIIFLIVHKKPAPSKPVATNTAAPAPASTMEASRLTGVPVTPEQNKRPVRGFMIENSPDARPQSGLTQAEVVFEAVAEGGITRFLALFQINRPDYLGPVRSARPYYLDFLLPFDAPLGHAGGSPDALAQIKALGVKDLDQFANAGAYQRVSSRFAPHNLYTSMDKIDALMNQKGFTTSTFTSWPRKAEAASAAPTAKSIDFNISSFLYNPHWDYDAATNSYKRSEGGKPHTDEKSGAQISPKVVLALTMGKGLAADRLHSTYNTSGSGHLYVFQDGVVTEGTWSKGDHKDPFTFKDAAGQPLKLNPGQTWLSIVDANSKVSFKP